VNPNPVLRKLGFADDDRVVIIHADDVGMCQASVAAFAELVDFGLVSSGAAMVPCPWFLEAAAYCREHPEADVGVHSTLTSEWETYRWGPVSTRDAASGLLDSQGCFHRTTQAIHANGRPEAVQVELQAQLARALAAGIDVTHLDTHMGAVAHPKFMPGYVQLALAYGLPPLMLRLEEAGWQAMGLDPQAATYAAGLVRKWEEEGLPLLDSLAGLPLDQPDDRLAQAKGVFDTLPAGLTHLIIHPAVDTPELRAITPDAAGRVADYQAFGNAELRDYVRDLGVRVIGYRALRELMRESR
jgi:predicted glycoside hydrolase/deacetylase ChbG (UPF0249 family)